MVTNTECVCVCVKLNPNMFGLKCAIVEFGYGHNEEHPTELRTVHILYNEWDCCPKKFLVVKVRSTLYLVSAFNNLIVK